MMWGEQFAPAVPSHMSYGMRISKSAPCSPVKPASKRPPVRADSFHVVHKVPVGDTPYVKAKHVQLVDKDPDRAIVLFWAAINAGDRVDSALKDMAIVMKQQNRPQEAIEAIKSLRNRCSDQAQESLDNVLLDLYKRCGRLDDQIDLLKHKLHLIHQGMAFNGKRTKTARSQGKKFQVSIEQEATRLLGNLGWAYMQQSNFVAAEAVYRKALSIEPDNNKVCNLGICLMKQGRLEEAKAMLQSVTPACNDNRWASDSHLKSYERAQEMLQELEASMGANGYDNVVQELRSFAIPGCDTGCDLQHSSLWQPQPALPRQPRRMARSNLDQQFSQSVDPSMTGALLATAGFGPSKHNSNSRAPTSRSQAHAPSQQADQSWFQSALSSGWSDEDLDYSSPEEYSNSDMQSVQGGKQEQNQAYRMQAGNQPLNWHAETLRQRLETVSVLGNAFMNRRLGMKLDANSGSGLRTPVNEQALSCDAAPFTPAPFSPAKSVPSRPKSAAGNGSANDSKAPSTVDRAPLTFDLTNGIRNGANTNSQSAGQGENRIVKPLGAAAGWTSNKPAPRGNPPGYGNVWPRSGEYDENLVMKVDPNSGSGLRTSVNEQALSCDAAPFTLAPFSPAESIPSRPKSAAGNGSANASKAPSTVDRAPLTFDLTNGIRNGANTNSQSGGQGENRIVKPLGAPAGWTTNKPAPRGNPPGYGNVWPRSGEYDENKPTARRSLSMDSIETTFAEQPQMIPQPLQNQNVNISSGGLPPLHNAVGKRSRTLTPVKEKTVSAWGSLGFTQSPNDLDFGCENIEGEVNGRDALTKSLFSRDQVPPIPMADLSASEMEMKRQRRLKVFREMTLTGSPQA